MQSNDQQVVPGSEPVAVESDDTFPASGEAALAETPAVTIDAEAIAAINTPAVEPTTVPPVVPAPAPVAEEQEQPAVKPREPRAPSTTVQQDAEVTAPLVDKFDSDRHVLLSIPPESREVIKEVLGNMPNIDLDETVAGQEWKMTLEAAAYSVPAKDYFTATMARGDARWRQTVGSERGPLAADAPKFSDNTAKLTGERAVLRVRALTGLGSVVRIPLWHSGFWISFKAPTDGSLLELNRRLAEEKITLGRQTYGLAFANNSVMYNGWLMDFALAHIYDSSLKTELQDDMRNHISSLDIPTIAWGLACVIWPGGFPYARAILDQTTEENKVIKELLKIGKLQFVDNAALSPWQISHMAGRHGNTMTLDSVKRYRDEFVRGKGRLIQLSEKVSITLRNPSLDQYLASGQKWVNNIVSMVDRSLGMAPSDNARDQYIMEQGKASNMRQYAHFVESIEADGQTIDDAETIESVFDALSTDDKIRDVYFKGVREYIEDSTIAVIAIPVTEEGEKSPLPRFPHLLAIDATSVFFILLVQKVQHNQGR